MAEWFSCTPESGTLLAMAIVPAWLVDRLPLAWWTPGNLHQRFGCELHFCTDDHVRTVELNGRVVAQGKKLFPYDHDWG